MAKLTDAVVTFGSVFDSAATNNGTPISSINSDIQTSAAAMSLAAAFNHSVPVTTASIMANGVAFHTAMGKLAADWVDPTKTTRDILADVATVVGDGAGATGAMAELMGATKVGTNMSILGGVTTGVSMGLDFNDLVTYSEQKINAILGAEQDVANANWNTANPAFNNLLNSAYSFLNNSSSTNVAGMQTLVNACTAYDASLAGMWNSSGFSGQSFSATVSGSSVSVNNGATSLATGNVSYNSDSLDAIKTTNSDGSGTIIADGQAINYASGVTPTVSITPTGQVSVGITPSGGTSPTSTFNLSGEGISGSNADGLLLNNISIANDGSYTNSVVAPDSIASTTYDVFGRPTSGLQTFTDGSHVDTSYSTVSSNTWVSRQNIYDSNGDLIGSTTLNKDNTTNLVQIDPATNATYSVTLDAQGNAIPGSASFTAGTASQPSAYAQFTSAVIDTLATQLITQVLIKNNLPASIAATAFASATIKSATGVGTTGNFNTDFANSVVSIAGGIGGSALGSLIAKNLGLPTQVGSLIGGVGGNLLTQAIVNEAAQAMGFEALTGVTFAANSGEIASAFSSGLSGAGGGLLGSYLGGLITGNTSADAQIGGAVGGAAGGVIGSLIPVIGTFIGAVIGSFIGELIGGIFDQGRGRPWAEGEITIVNGQFQVVNTAVDNGTTHQDAYAFTTPVANYLNQILANIGGTATSSQSWWLGFHAERGFVFIDGAQNSTYFPDQNSAVQYAIFQLLRSVVITGGNPMMVWELQNSTATNINDLLSDLGIAQNYQLISTSSLAVQAAVAASGDITQYQNLQTQITSAQSKGLNRLSWDGATLTIKTTATQIAGDLNTLSHMPGTAYKFAFADTGANITSALSSLEAQAAAGHIASVIVTDGTPPTFSFSMAQIVSNFDALKLLQGSFVLNVTDTAANVAANLDKLQTLASANALTSISLTGTGTQTLSISATQLLNDAVVLAKIATAHNYVINDTAANISKAFANLISAQTAGLLVSVTTSDTGTAVVSLSVAQTNQTTTLAKFTKAYNFALADTGANVAANLSGWQTQAASGKLVSITLTDPATASLSVTLAQTTSYATVLSMLAGQATLNVTGIQPNVATTVSGNGLTIPLAINDNVTGTGTDTYTSNLSGKPIAVTLTNSHAVVDASGNITFTTPLTGFGSSALIIGANGKATFTVGSDVVRFRNNALQSVSYSNGVFSFGIAPAPTACTETITWNPTTGMANLVVTASGKPPVTTSLGQINPGTVFYADGSTINNINASGQTLLSTTVNADGTQVDTTYNYAGGNVKDTAVTLNTSGQQTAIRYDHTDGSSYTTFTNPTTQAVIANLTINADSSGSISTANNQTVAFAAGNIASASVGAAGDTLLTLKTLSGSGITENIDLSTGKLAIVSNSNTLLYALANAGVSVDASGNMTITGGGSTLVLPANGSNATMTVGTAVLPFPQAALQSISSVNGAYQFGLTPSAYGFTETLSWNSTTGMMNLLVTSAAAGTTATTSLGLFNPGDILSISGSTISITTSTGTAKSSTTINADGTQSNTFNNGAGALHVVADGTTTFIYGGDQLIFKPNMLLSSSYAGGLFTFNIATPSSAYTESITWNPTTGMANLILTASGKSPVTTSLGQVNPGNIFMVASNAVSLAVSASQPLQSTTINADGSQVGVVYAYTGTNKITTTTLNNSGQQTSIRWDHTDGSSYTSYTNPTNQAAIANLSINADGSGYVATNNNQTINFAAHNLASVSIGSAGDTLLTIKTQSGMTETLDMSSGTIVSTVNGKALTYTLANAGASIDASGNVTITGGGSTIVIPANGSNAIFTVGQDSISLPQNALQSLSNTNGAYIFGVTSSVTGYSEAISWYPTSGKAKLILTPIAGGSAVISLIGQINPGNVLTLAGNTLNITASDGTAISSNEIYLDGSQVNIYYNNSPTVNETVTSINAAGQTTSVRWDNTDGSQYTSYYTPSTGVVVANRQVNADGSGYVATANNHTVNFAAGNLAVVSLDSSGNPFITLTNISGNQLTQTLDVQASQIASTINGRTLTYGLPNPSISYDGSGNLTLAAAGSTLLLPANGGNYNFSVGQDTLSLDPASTTAVLPNGAAYNFNLVSAAGAGTSEYVTWNPQTGIATLNSVNSSNQTTSYQMGYVNPGDVLKITSSIITNTNSSGQVTYAYGLESDGTAAWTVQNQTASWSLSNKFLALSTGDTISLTGSSDTIYASTNDTITNTGNAANTYVYGSGFGTQTLNNAGAATGAAKGSLQFAPGITDENLWLKQVGNDLEIDQLGTANKLTISGWFTNASSQVSSIQTNGDGLKLDSGVAQLLSTMASYSSSHTGFNPSTAGTVMPTDTTLQNAIAANWHH